MRLIAALFAGAVLAAPVHADRMLDDPHYWMTRIAESAKSAHYHGEVIYRHGDKVEAMELVRRGGPDGYFERLLTLDGVPREVMRDGKSVTCILPGGRASLAGERIPRNPFPGEQWRYSDEVAQHYDFLDLGEARVAGRSCKVIGIQPRDRHRYGYRLWVDHASGLLLRSDIIAEDGQVIEQVAFTRVRLPDALDERYLAATLDGEVLSWAVHADDTNVVPAWTIGAVPAGFEEKTVRSRRNGTVQHVLTDGLATVSVFVTPTADQRPGLAGTSRMGAVSAFGTVINGHQVTVVGEVPVGTVQSIGEALLLDLGP